MEIESSQAAPLDHPHDTHSPNEEEEEEEDDEEEEVDEEEHFVEEEELNSRDEEGIVEEEEMVHLDVLDDIGSDEEGTELQMEEQDVSYTEEEMIQKKEFQCDYCNYSTNRRSDLTRHVRGHTGENLFHCVKCEYKTARKSDLRRHHLLHAGEKPFKCGVCNYTTSRKTVLLKHMRIHTANLPRCRVILVQVSKDGQKVINNNALADLPTSSSNTLDPKSTPTKKRRPSNPPVKMYSCDKCDFVAACRKNYHEHRLSHGKEQKWKCPMCGYMTIRKSDMTRHFNIHIDNVFKCNLCEYKTVRHSDFVRHSKTHAKHKYQ